MFQALREDLELLLQQNRKENWTSKSPVPNDRFTTIERPRARSKRVSHKTSPAAATPALNKPGREELGSDEIRTWEMREDIAQWLPGDRVTFVSRGLSTLWTVIAAVIAWSVAGSVAQGIGGGRIGFLAASLSAGLLAYWLLRRPKREVRIDWHQQAIFVRGRLGKREYAFGAIEAVRVKVVADRPTDDTAPVEYSGLLQIDTTDDTLTILHGITSDEDPTQVCGALETVAQWLAATLDRPYASANAGEDESTTTGIQGAVQHVALGQVALKRARYAQQVDGETGDQYVKVALDHFGEAMRVEPDNVKLLLELAELCSSRGDHSQAIAAYSLAIKACPQRADLYRSRGFLHNLEEQFDHAISDYSEAIRMQPEDDSGYRSRGEVYKKAEDYEQAVADFTKCLDLTKAGRDDKTLDEIRVSNRSSMYAERADTYRKRGDLKRAFADIKEAIELEPNNRFAQIVQAELKKAIDIAS